jgi:hypothetical protein
MIKRSKIGENVKRREERKAKLQASLDSIANQLKDCGALKIIHFGPLARGEVDVKSDLDLLAIMPSSKSGGEWTNFIYDNAEGKIDSKIIVYNEKSLKKSWRQTHFWKMWWAREEWSMKRSIRKRPQNGLPRQRTNLKMPMS